MFPSVAEVLATDSAAWTDAAELGVEGRAFDDTPSIFNRLPAAAQDDVRPAVWGLILNSAGLFVRFETDSPSISLNYTLRGRPGNMRHFPASGMSGCDLYARSYDNEGSYTWRYVGAAFQQLNMNSVTQAGVVATGLQSAPGMHSFMLHLPTYNEIVSAHIGVQPGARIQKDSKPAYRQDAIVWYGTSILQGGVSSRPGNIFTHKISRRLNRTIFNFGFSGNGKMELGVAKHLATIPSVSLIIVDCNWNMDGASISSSTEPLVQYFRTHGHPTTPIILAEGTPAGGECCCPKLRTQRQLRGLPCVKHSHDCRQLATRICIMSIQVACTRSLTTCTRVRQWQERIQAI